MKIRRGEVWRVDLSNAKGAEITKSRPCAVVNDNDIAEAYVAVINNDAIGVLPLKIVVPLTEWKKRYEIAQWHIPIEAKPENGLRKKSSADTFQVRSISETRFIEKIGELTRDDLEKIRHGLAICLCIDD